MSQELIISISGMRGLIGKNLFPETASAYGSTFGTFLKKRHTGQENPFVAIGRDSRPSGQMIFSAVAGGLMAVGVNVIDLGICSTPAVGVMLRHLNCAGGVMITASHNPTPYNGVKLLLENGIAPPKEMAEQIIQMYQNRQFAFVDSLACGTLKPDTRANQIHLDKVLAIVDKDKITSKRFKVVLDSVNGAGGAEGLMLLEALGCEVVPMNIEPTGMFAHTPEPTAENLVSLCQKVADSGAVIGFAQDPDADRLAIVDANGSYIGEEFTLAFAAQHIFSKMRGTAAVNLSTSRMIDDIAAKAGCKTYGCPVAQPKAPNAMIKNDCIIGGEGNGGVIDLRVGPIRDSLVGMALVLELLAKTDKTVSQLVSDIGGYTMHKSKYPADKEQATAIIEKAKAAFREAELNTSDGCRLGFPNGRMLIRASNTEPIMRIIVETKDPAVTKQYLDTIEAIRLDILKL